MTINHYKTGAVIRYIFLSVRLMIALVIIVNLVSCATDMGIGKVVISKPDEYRQVYEAKEKVILRAIARVFKDKSIGTNISIDLGKNIVRTDYIISGDWRIKSIAQVKKINWKESEVILSIITEAKIKEGWEMRRLLEKEQYDSFFSVIDLAIYEEMSRIE